jgi:metallo-beta-lactamase family protein
VIFVGYQGEGSLGRRLVEGAKQVQIFGETVPVAARIATISAFSGHAGQSELLRWFDPLAASARRIVLTHGEEESRVALARALSATYPLDTVTLPQQGEALLV